MDNFNTFKSRENSVMNPFILTTEPQQWSTCGQSRFIYLPLPHWNIWNKDWMSYYFICEHCSFFFFKEKQREEQFKKHNAITTAEKDRILISPSVWPPFTFPLLSCKLFPHLMGKSQNPNKGYIVGYFSGVSQSICSPFLFSSLQSGSVWIEKTRSAVLWNSLHSEFQPFVLPWHNLICSPTPIPPFTWQLGMEFDGFSVPWPGDFRGGIRYFHLLCQETGDTFFVLGDSPFHTGVTARFVYGPTSPPALHRVEGRAGWVSKQEFRCRPWCWHTSPPNQVF